ncbi:MAG: YjbQ family protein [Spirochaetales bacterium]|nr:YjbQ family protein [Spirochaetales bacterium]
MVFQNLKIQTNEATEFVDITSRVRRVIADAAVSDGICTVFIPHTTCGVTINEAADPDVKRDMLMELNKIVPLSDGYQHMEGNSAAHIKTSMMGLSVLVPIQNSRLLLGTWQGIYLCEFDGPRSRSVYISIQ